MNFNLLDEAAIAAGDVNQHLKQLADAVAPELKPLVPAKIRAERVSFTRNASNTPYVVYWVGDRRCSTFIKRARTGKPPWGIALFGIGPNAIEVEI